MGVAYCERDAPTLQIVRRRPAVAQNRSGHGWSKCGQSIASCSRSSWNGLTREPTSMRSRKFVT